MIMSIVNHNFPIYTTEKAMQGRRREHEQEQAQQQQQLQQNKT
jgi:hypothetical protein